MKNKYIFIAIVWLSYSFSLLGNDLNSYLSISIYNESQIALEGANITMENKLTGESYGSSSDNEGMSYFRKIEKGRYDISIKFIGYYDYKDSIIIDSDQHTKNIIMKIKSIPIAELEIISELEKREIAGTINYIDADMLTLIKPMGTQEILERIPGINGFSDDGIGNSRINIGIRGINPRRSSRVLILEDGIPIQPAIYVYPNMYYNPPSERIHKVEVIKGSGAILYGPQTMGGVVNYLTKKPNTNSKPAIKITAGNNDYISTFIETGTISKIKYNPEMQLLYKRGNGFRENNDFYQINGTFKLNYNKNKNENYYFKSNINKENTNATYTGLTLYSFENNPNFNPKEHDNFDILRVSTDLIHTKEINENITVKTSSFLSYFDRKWWRENDVFINADSLDSYQDNNTIITEDYDAPYNDLNINIVRYGDNQYSFGILRRFFVAGVEKKYILKNLFLKLENTIEVGGRFYFERFIDDKKKGYEPDSRDGLYYIPAEDFIDGDDGTKGVYDEGEEFTDCNEDHTICEGDENWDSSMGNDTWDDVNRVGQSQHYESTAFSGFLSQEIILNPDSKNKFIINPGVRLEIFEQEKIDRLNGSTYQDKTTFVLLPGFGFNKQINNFNIFGGIHRGFTPPSSGAMKIVNFGEDVDSEGLDLKAEKSWNKELGFRYKSLLIDSEVALFHLNIEDMVAAGRMVDFKNLGKVETMGLEFYSSLYLSNINHFLPDFSLSYTNLKTEVIDGIITSSVNNEEIDITGNELPYAPNHTYTAGLSFNFIKKIKARLDYKYVGSVYTDFQNLEDDDENYFTYDEVLDDIEAENGLTQNVFVYEYRLGIVGPIPSYNIINISADYQFNEKLSFNLSIKNLQDKIYIGSRLHSHPGEPEANRSSGIIPGPRRQINFGMQYTF